MEHLKKIEGGVGGGVLRSLNLIELGGGGVHPKNPTPSSPNRQSELIYFYHVHFTLISIYLI